MYLRPGERLTLEELLYGLLLCSGNDAALALTECAGGVAPFVERMNEKAAALGMADSHFANPNGLDDEAHYSTAYDMALLGCAAVNEPTLRRMASTRTAVIGGRTLTNHNKLLSRLDGCVGLKTGYTKAAGRTLVSCAEQAGHRLVAVTLRDGDDWNDHEALYRWGFLLTGIQETLETRLLGARVDRRRTRDRQRTAGPCRRQGGSGDGRYPGGWTAPAGRGTARVSDAAQAAGLCDHPL